jgi:hypothetical protein
MKIRNFIINIKDGNITWKSEDHKNLFLKWLRQFDDNQYRLCIEDVKEKRSDQQNRYYWGVYLPLISEETGHTTEELHSLFKGMFLSEVKSILGKPTRISKSTSKLKKGEFCEYIINIETETGIQAPDTTAYLGYSYRK